MASNQKLVLFDIPTRYRPGKAWSPNTVKIRLLLNFKGVPFETHWVEYPDIKTVLEPHVPPNTPEQGALYTVPTVKLSDGTYLMDSPVIAAKICELYPDSPLALQTPNTKQLEEASSDGFKVLSPVLAPKVPTTILQDGSVPYWRETRSKSMGKPLEEFETPEIQAKAWNDVQPMLEKVTALLKKKPETAFFGDTVSYDDFKWAAMINMIKTIGGEVWEEFLKRTGDASVHEKLLAALDKWM